MERNRALRNILLAGIGLIALFLIMGAPEMLGFGPRPEVKAYAERQIAPLDGPSAKRLLATHRGSPTLFFAYASWCPYCKEQAKMLRALQTRYPDGLKILYISLDDDVYKLGEYLMATYPDKPFTPYHVAMGEDRASFDAAVQELGFTPDGAIPHLMLFDAEGKTAGEFKGLTQIPVLLDAVKAAQ